MLAKTVRYQCGPISNSVGCRSTNALTSPEAKIMNAIASTMAAIMIATMFAIPTAVITESSRWRQQ